MDILAVLAGIVVVSGLLVVYYLWRHDLPNFVFPHALVCKPSRNWLTGWMAGRRRCSSTAAHNNNPIEKIVNEIVYMPPPDKIKSIKDMPQPPLEITFVRRPLGRSRRARSSRPCR